MLDELCIPYNILIKKIKIHQIYLVHIGIVHMIKFPNMMLGQ